MAGQSIAYRTINEIAERLVNNPVNYRVGWVVDALGASLFLRLGLGAPGSWMASAAAALAGLIAWGFVEYALHRWLGHGPPSFARRGHAHHHSNDAALIAAPIFAVLIGAFTVWAVLSLIVPGGVASLLVFGLYVGYNYYGLLHHLLHHHEAFAVRIGLQRLEHVHSIHHGLQTVNFGVTTTLWDRVLGTYQAPVFRARRDRS